MIRTVSFLILCFLPALAFAGGQNSFTVQNLFIPDECPLAPTLNIPAGTATDRYNRSIVDDEDLIQNLIKEGQAIVYPSDFNDDTHIENLMALENTARKNRTGCVWQNNNFITPHDRIEKTGTFMIVEGVVLDVYESRNNRFLNFGADWKNDFTIRIENTNKHFKGFDLKGFKGKKIRARGFIESYNGPSLTLTHPILLEDITNDQ